MFVFSLLLSIKPNPKENLNAWRLAILPKITGTFFLILSYAVYDRVQDIYYFLACLYMDLVHGQEEIITVIITITQPIV